MLSPGSNGFPSLLRDLEKTICARLDHIDAALQRLGGLSDTVKAQDDAWESNLPCIPFTQRAPAAELPIQPVGDEGNIGPEDTYRARTSMLTPRNDPLATLVLRSEWEEWSWKESDQSTVMLVNSRLSRRRVPKTLSHGEQRSRAVPWWIVVPNRPFRLCWDLMTSFLIAHDMAVVPFNLAFEIGGNPVSDALFWPFALFWTMDLPLSFFTAIYRGCNLEVRMAKIAIHYLRTWFIIDVFVVGSTWFEVLINLHDGILLGRIGKSMRILRVIRTLRFVRVVKLGRITQELHDRISSEYHHIVLTVVKLILTIVWLNHFIACGWWAVGVSTSKAGFENAWTLHYRLEGAALDWQYFTSLHWSLTQFTPAGMEVSAQNTPERIYSVFVLLFAMVTFSSFVSSITAAMTQLRQLHSRHATNLGLLRRFLDSRRLPIDLITRILHCVEQRVGQQHKEVQEGEVQYLKLLSQPLKAELTLHISGPILERHPFLRRYAEVGMEPMRQVCLEAVERCLLSTKDVLFSEGQPCKRMFFMVSGCLRYNFKTEPPQQIFGRADGQDQAHEALPESAYCCEVSLWCPWVHRGTMEAELMTEVLALDVSAFTAITCAHDTVNRFGARYGKLFIDAMQKELFSGAREISDLSVFEHDTVDDLVERAYLKQAVHSPVDLATSPPSGEDDGGEPVVRQWGTLPDREKSASPLAEPRQA
uniref:Ion transport domain-containing protein n=1 Tax=Alexandrium catenella TaxID=2925 RepID=A0A7S1QJM9_ALECA|mmetsp:Transcript_33530/g.90754  ORF Transcript_33530/g.90754 Transcript_33530/m.90754 type:complete len:703 (+) Transcript_33530:1-2109(+)